MCKKSHSVHFGLGHQHPFERIGAYRTSIFYGKMRHGNGCIHIDRQGMKTCLKAKLLHFLRIIRDPLRRFRQRTSRSAPYAVLFAREWLCRNTSPVSIILYIIFSSFVSVNLNTGRSRFFRAFPSPQTGKMEKTAAIWVTIFAYSVVSRSLLSKYSILPKEKRLSRNRKSFF